MATTTEIEIQNEWVLIGSVSETTLIQLKGSGAVDIRVEDSLPTDSEGFTLSTSGLREICIHASSGAGNIYAKAKLYPPVSVVVLKIPQE